MAEIRVKNMSLHYRIMEKLENIDTDESRGAGSKIDIENQRVIALENLSFTLRDGDRLAIVGRNGGGKSTLLNVLAGILVPTSGDIFIDGDVSAIFNVGLGIRQDSTGMKNIEIRCLMAGLPRSEIPRIVESVREFSELGEYLHIPVRRYSSGMAMRLNLALSTAIESEILLLDEWIGTGDAAFREKIAERMTSFVDQTKIVVLASHSLNILKRVCNKALWLHRGKVVEFGDIDPILAAYRDSLKLKN